MKQNQDLIGLAILKGLSKINARHTLYLPGEIGMAAMKQDADTIHDELNKVLDKLERGGADRE